MKTFKKFILSLDQFGSEITLSVKNEKVHNTYPGSIVSILIFGFVAYSFVMLIIDMVYNQQPNVISIERSVPNPAPYILKSTDYFFAINVVDGYGIPLLQNDSYTIYTAEA